MRLSLQDNSLLLTDCFDKQVRTYIKVLRGKKNGKFPKDWNLPVTLDAIQYLDREASCDIDPSVHAFVKEIEFNVERAKLPEEDLRYQFHPNEPPPFPHQRVSFWFCTHLDHNIALLGTGLGKTRLAIDVLCYRHLNDDVNLVLIVAPSSIHTQWKREIERFSTVENIELRRIEGRTKNQRLKIIQKPIEEGRLTILLSHYEAVRIREIEKALKKLKPQMAITDESTFIKNHKAKQTKSVTRITRSCKFRMALTGTPIWNRPQDIFGQYWYLDPFWFGDSYMIFKHRFLLYGEGWEEKTVVGYQNTEEMSRRIYSIGIRFRKEDCLKDLPPRTYHRRVIEMTNEQRKLYNEAEKEFIVFIEKADEQDMPRAMVIQNALVRLLRLQQICCGHTSDQNKQTVILPTDKLKEVDIILDEIMGEKERKIVIWCRFVQDILLLYDLLSPKYPCSKFYGTGMDVDLREKELRAFQGEYDTTARKWIHGPNQIFIAQIKTGGVGLDLWMADTAIFYSLDWSLGVREQAEGRNFRKGSEVHQAVTYFDIVCQGSIEERILAVLQEKKELADLIMQAKSVKELKKLFFGKAA
jgi:SNF2 family DNA or RNA helicase